MFKKLYENYGSTVLFYGILISMLIIGFIIGFYGKSAPDLKTVEMCGVPITSDVASVETVKAIEPPTASEETHEKHTDAAQYNKITVTATAYCPCEKCCGKTDGITATGTKATAGRTIAVDPNVIPYGTELIINGNTYVAEDCGGAIKGNDIDVFFNTHEEALNFGRQELTAYILN